jgi:hypothetical protein
MTGRAAKLFAFDGRRVRFGKRRKTRRTTYRLRRSAFAALKGEDLEPFWYKRKSSPARYAADELSGKVRLRRRLEPVG